MSVVKCNHLVTKEFQDKTPEGEVLDKLKLTRYCCRRHILTHVDIEYPFKQHLNYKYIYYNFQNYNFFIIIYYING